MPRSQWLQSILLIALFAPPHVTCLSVITGANGYLGQAVCHSLLSIDDDEDCILLVRPERLAETKRYWEPHNAQVFPYDMLDGGESLRDAITTVAAAEKSRTTTTTVYHIASVFGPTEDHEATAHDNVRGTIDLVETLAKIGNCRLVLTSSMAAVRGSGQSPMNGEYYTADDWNVKSQLGSNWGSSYQWSKKESERIAWDLCGRYNLPMTSLCPSFIFGPSIASMPSSSYSLRLVKEWLSGESPVQSRLFVDVRDVALAHVRAGHRDTAIGKRYIVSTERRVPSSEIANWLIESMSHTANNLNPDKIHCDTAFKGGAIAIGQKEVEATELLKSDLDIELRTLESTISDMCDDLLANLKQS